MSFFFAKIKTRKILLPEQDFFSFSIESGREPLLLQIHFYSTVSLWPTFDVLSTFARSTNPRSPSTSRASLAPFRSTWSSWTSPPSAAMSPLTSTIDVDASSSHDVRRSRGILGSISSMFNMELSLAQTPKAQKRQSSQKCLLHFWDLCV